jgi:predicted RNA-binding protein with EMAP domain
VVVRSTYPAEELTIRQVMVVAATANADNLLVATLNCGDFSHFSRIAVENRSALPDIQFLSYRPCP